MFFTKNMIRGIGSVINIAPGTNTKIRSYGYNNNPAQTDFNALKNDFETIGNDLRIVMNGQEKKKVSKNF